MCTKYIRIFKIYVIYATTTTVDSLTIIYLAWNKNRRREKLFLRSRGTLCTITAKNGNKLRISSSKFELQTTAHFRIFSTMVKRWFGVDKFKINSYICYPNCIIYRASRYDSRSIKYKIVIYK